MRNQFGRVSLRSDRDFRWRGENVSRVEGFSDAVFAFAMTLLVVSLEVPRNFSELLLAMQGFPAFAICFTFLIWIWYTHYIFFRRYALHDSYTIVLNAILLFVVLFYIYPLKFVFTFLLRVWFGLGGQISASTISGQDMPFLMITYSLGFLAIFSLFLLLYLHAYKKRSELELTDVEVSLTCFQIHAHMIHMAVALLSILISLVLGSSAPALAGIIYSLIGPARAIHGVLYGKRIEQLKEGLTKS